MGPGGSSNQGRLSVDLKPLGERTLTADEVINELRRKARRSCRACACSSRTRPPSASAASGRSSVYQYTLQGSDTAELYAAGAEARAGPAQRCRGLVDVSSDLQLANPQVNVSARSRSDCRARPDGRPGGEPRWSNAYSTHAGLDHLRADQRVPGDHARRAASIRTGPTRLSLLYVRSSRGTLVPLSSRRAASHRAWDRSSVNHTGQLPSVTLSFNLAPGVALGDATARVQTARARGPARRRSSASFQGTAQAFQDSLTGLGVILVMAIFVIYVVLGILYESFIHPITILSGLPAAGLGRAADAAALPRRPQPVRVRRRHHAGRAGEEERDHDDRLRDRGAAHGRAPRRARPSTKPAWSASGRS